MHDATTANTVTVQIVYDLACPWCYIGKRRLEHAMAGRLGLRCRLRWWPYLLHPELPEEGVERTTYLARRYGSEARVRRVLRGIADAGQSTRIDFAFDRIRRTPNTVNAHRLVRFAETEGLADAAVEALFHSHFVDGRDIGDASALLRIGVGIGLDRDSLAVYLASGAGTADVHNDYARAARLGLNGVPTFLFAERFVVAGAQEAQVLTRMLDVAHEGGRALARLEANREHTAVS